MSSATWREPPPPPRTVVMRSGDLAPLPRGRHKLSRSEVEQSQRLRLLLAMAEALLENGYAATPVAAILDRAGVSRQTFYQLYDNKLDCFLDGLDLVSETLDGQLRRAFDDATGTPLERAGAAVDHYLDTLGSNLAFARLYIVEVHAAGSQALLRRAELQERVTAALVSLVGAEDEDARFACECYVAAIAALVTLPVATGDVEALRALRRPLLGQLARLVSS